MRDSNGLEVGLQTMPYTTKASRPNNRRNDCLRARRDSKQCLRSESLSLRQNKRTPAGCPFVLAETIPGLSTRQLVAVVRILAKRKSSRRFPLAGNGCIPTLTVTSPACQGCSLEAEIDLGLEYTPNLLSSFLWSSTRQSAI